MTLAVQEPAAVTSPGKLIVPPAEAARAVWTQLERGRAIRKSRIRHAEELEKAREVKAEWVGQTIDLLKSMFDTESVAMEFSIIDARVLPDYAEVGLFIEVFYEEMDQRIGRLESVYRRIPVNHGAGNGAARPNGNGNGSGTGSSRLAAAAAAASLQAAAAARAVSPSPAAAAASAESVSPSPVTESRPADPEPLSVEGGSCLLVVHGEGGEAAERMAAFVSLLGFDAERVQADAGDAKAVIEALDARGDSRFAIMLLDGPTAAAVRAGSGDPLDRRFVFQLGCCIGRLGMRRACVLVPEGIPQLPEEHGVMFLPMDAADGWQLQLARQLKRSGIEVDLNRLV
jgi:hypothetical protein